MDILDIYFCVLFYQQDNSQSYAQFTPCSEYNKHPVHKLILLGRNTDVSLSLNPHEFVDNAKVKFYFKDQWIFILSFPHTCEFVSYFYSLWKTFKIHAKLILT